MPAYIYQCPACGARFETQRRFGEPHPTLCPHGHTGVQRVFAPPIVIFKGSGFYVTDNGRNGLVSRRKDKTASETSQETAKTEKTENNV